MSKGSDILVRALENEGVDYVFGLPGEENLDFLESLRTSSIKLVVTRHEQAAAFMAATYGRLTGKPGVCFSTLGPGATNLVTGAAYALLGGLPMLMITGQKPILQSRQARFQIIDAVGMMEPLTKQAKQIIDAHNIPTMVRDAFRIAQEERPGPVHLELPEDIAAQEVEHYELVPVTPYHHPIAPEAAIEAAAQLLLRAKHPLVMIGGGANRPGLSRVLSPAIASLGIPVFNTQMGKGAVDGVSHLFLGTAALSQDDYIHRIIEKADMILAIGHDTVEKPPFIMHDSGPTVIHMDFNIADIDMIYRPQLEVVGDIGDSATRLSRRLQGARFDVGPLLEKRKALWARIAEGADDERFPIAPQRLVADVRKVLPDDGILSLDNGMYKIWFARNYRTHVANTLLLDNALASMGAGLPAAIEAALLYPERKVVAVCGDGGFMMNSQELETAIRLGVSLTVLIIEDNAYGMIRWKQEAEGFADFGLTFQNPEFVAYAEAYGAKGVRVNSAEELAPALRRAMAEGGVQIVVAPIDYSANKKLLEPVPADAI
ncbi:MULTISPECIES: acetolactate synthase large subunit [Rhodomicrobium]|uniref:acetolactate synthase large subunit n=1 Tax=Rhodomicrobium TaxID=1068 RepID=UPI000B4AD78D|nr:MULTISPECIES: acetolactate synthase large subunit [Rhodomicrobium]